MCRHPAVGFPAAATPPHAPPAPHNGAAVAEGEGKAGGGRHFGAGTLVPSAAPSRTPRLAGRPRASAALALRVRGSCTPGRPRRWVVCRLLAARGVPCPAPGGQQPREVSCGKRRHLWAGPVLLETPTQPLPGRGRGEACQRAGFGDRVISPGVGRVAWPRTQGSLRGDRAATGPHSPGFPGFQPWVCGSQPWVRGVPALGSRVPALGSRGASPGFWGPSPGFGRSP